MPTIRELVTRWLFETDEKKVKAFARSVEDSKKEVEKSRKELDQESSALYRHNQRLVESRKTFQEYSEGLRTISDRVSGVGRALTTAVTLPLAAAAVGMVKIGSDANEAQSKFEVVFGSNKDEMEKWAEGIGDSIGRSKVDLKDWAATVADTFGPLGMSSDAAKALGKQVTMLAVDLSSFYNTTESDALQGIMSALVGNHEAVRKFGVMISQTTLEQELFNMGVKGGADDATELQKSMARLNLIFKGTPNAQGDAIRTSDEFANTIRAIKGEAKDVAVIFTNDLLPELTTFAQYVRGLVHEVKQLDPATRDYYLKLALVVGLLGPAIWLIGGVAGAFLNLAAMYKALTLAQVENTAAATTNAGATAAAGTAATAAAVEVGAASTSMSSFALATKGATGAFLGPAGLLVAVAAGIALILELNSLIKETWAEWDKVDRLNDSFDKNVKNFGPLKEVNRMHRERKAALVAEDSARVKALDEQIEAFYAKHPDLRPRARALSPEEQAAKDKELLEKALKGGTSAGGKSGGKGLGKGGVKEKDALDWLHPGFGQKDEQLDALIDELAGKARQAASLTALGAPLVIRPSSAASPATAAPNVKVENVYYIYSNDPKAVADEIARNERATYNELVARP